MDDGIISVYTAELIALAEKFSALPRPENPHLSAQAISPVCGSEVTAGIVLQGSKIKEIGFTVEACALTKAVLAVMHGAAPGKTREDIAEAGNALKSMLENGSLMPSGDWAQLRLLAPVRDYPARHNALLLPFEAVEKAFRAGLAPSPEKAI